MMWDRMAPDDMRNERALRERVAASWNCETYPFADLDPPDFGLARGGRTFAIAEAKTRASSFRQFPDYLLSDHKLFDMRDLAAGMRIRGLLIVAFTNGDYFVDVHEARRCWLDHRARRDHYGRPEPPEWVCGIEWQGWRPMKRG